MTKRKHPGGGSDRHSPRRGPEGPHSKSAPFGGRSETGKGRFGKPGAGGRFAQPRQTETAKPSPRPNAAPDARFKGKPGDSGRPARSHRPSNTERAAPPRGKTPPDASAPAARPIDRAPEGRRQRHGGPNQIWLYGQHAVIAALTNGARKIHRLLLTNEAADLLGNALGAAAERYDRFSEEANTIHHIMAQAMVTTRDEIGRALPPGAVHQGFALLTEPLANMALEELLDRAAETEKAVVLVLDKVTDPQNVGAILRSAAAFGAAAVIVPDRHAPPETGALVKAASGAVEVVPLIRVINLARALEQLKEAGFWCAGLEGRAPQTLAAADLSGKVALVLGAEGEGLRRLTRDHCDILVRLPMSERMESLNVSAAAAVALYELARKA